METKHIVLIVIGAIIVLAIVYKRNCKTCNGVKPVDETVTETETETETETTPDTGTEKPD